MNKISFIGLIFKGIYSFGFKTEKLSNVNECGT